MASEYKKFPQQEVAGREAGESLDDHFRRLMREEWRNMNLVQRLCVDVDETAEMLGCSVSQVHNLEAEGKLTNVSYDRRLRFDMEQVKGLVRGKRKKAS
jgi:DNA-directed RNA polymerase specialized sigma24 family protein